MKNTDKYKLLKDFGALKKGDIVARRWQVINGNCVDSNYYCKVIEDSYDYKYELHLNLVQDNTEFFAPYCFTTRDGVDTYRGDDYYYIGTDNGIYMTKAHIKSEPTLSFSTKKAADNCLLLEEAKKRYPIGTKIKCLHIKDDVDSISSHKELIYCNNKNEIWFKGSKGKNMLVYYRGKWAEIVPKFEVGKWYSYKDKHFIKYKRTEKFNSYHRIVGEVINTYDHCTYEKEGSWANSEIEKNCTLLEDLSIIQPYLPDGHVDKVVFKIGDYIKTNSGNVHKIIGIVGENLEFVRVCGNNANLDIFKSACVLATNEEIISRYEKLGWVKGAKFIYEGKTEHIVYRLEVINGKVYVFYKELHNKQSGFDIENCKLVEQNEPHKSWEELKIVKGFYIDGNSSEIESFSGVCSEDNKNIFATKKQAESALAFAQLSQLVAKMNDGWVADWSDDSQPKFIIKRYGDTFDKSFSLFDFRPLCFKSSELRNLSLKKHRELWEKYYELE